MNLDLIFLIAFIFVQLLIGYFVSFKIKTKEDYFVAGRKNGPLLIGVSVFATWFGSEACMTSSGIFYTKGASGGRADPFGFALGLILFGLLIAPRIWKEKITTLGDLFKRQYGSKVEIMTSIILAITSIMWAAVQVRSFGQILVTHTHLSLDIAIVLATSVAVFYTAMGGLKADAYTDILQAGVIILGLLYLFFAVYSQFDAPVEAIYQLDPKRFNLLSSEDSFLVQLDGWMVPILGSLVAQELMSRASASRSAIVARKSSIVAGIMYLLVGLIPAFLGLMGPLLIPEIQDPEGFLILVAQKYLPHLAYLFFSCALISVILSTVDSTLLAVGALFANNMMPYVFPKLVKKYELGLSRLGVIITGLISCILAITSDHVFELVVLASSFGTSGILVATFFALYFKKGGPVHGAFAVASGTISFILFDFILELPAAYLWSLLVSFVGYLLPFLVQHSLKVVETRTIS